MFHKSSSDLFVECVFLRKHRKLVQRDIKSTTEIAKKLFIKSNTLNILIPLKQETDCRTSISKNLFKCL